MVGESLGEPCVAGAILSVRKLDATLSVWIADASDAEQNRRVGCRLREALELDDGALTWRSSNAHRRPRDVAMSGFLRILLAHTCII